MTYRFGRFAIDTVDRLLKRDGVVIPLTPKAADTLLLLLSKPGHVIEKHEFLSCIWPNSFVEEGSIAANISQLRGALGDSREKTVYIETIAKRGYRWVGEFNTSEVAAGFGTSQTQMGKRLFSLRFTIALALVIICGIGLYWAVLLITHKPSYELSLFTTYPGGEYEPSFSPDGRRIAFVWNGTDERYYDLYLRSIGSEQLVRLTKDTTSKGSPAWSGDGRRIAFIRYGSAAENGLFIISAADGTERKIGSIRALSALEDRHLDFSPVADELALVDKLTSEEGFSIFIVSAGTGERRRLTTPPAGWTGDTGPSFSPDGRHIAFLRTRGAGVNDLYLVSASGGEPKQITFDNSFISAHGFSASGHELIFCSNRRSGRLLWRVPVSGGDPQLITGIGEGANFLAVSRSGKRLAYSVWAADTNVWRFGLSASQGDPVAPVIGSTRTDVSPQFSPSGSKIAFRSNRSGWDEIWTCDATGENARPITNWRGPLAGSPRWSPDGSQVAFDSRPSGNSDIYLVGADGGEPKRVTNSHDNILPSWSADGRFVYFASNRDGSWQIWKAASIAHAGSDGAQQVTRHGGVRPIASLDEKFIYYAKSQSTDGLWRTPADGGNEELVSSDLKAGMWGNWDVGRDGIYLVRPAEPRGGDLLRLTLLGRTEIVRHFAKPPLLNDGGLAVSPDSRSVLYAQSDHSGSDILLVEHFQ